MTVFKSNAVVKPPRPPSRPYSFSGPFSTSEDATLPENIKQHDTECTCRRPLGPMGKDLVYRKKTAYPGLDVLRFS